jgi:2-(3-amino-3-carboxypropyl)histidine synthase
MKVMFVEVEYDEKVKLPKTLLEKLPEKVMLFTTAQFLKQLDSMKNQIEKTGKHVLLTMPRHTRHKGQILGCNVQEFIEDFDAFLYIGDGMFHPQALILKNNKPVFAYDPMTKEEKELSGKDVTALKKRVQGARAKFFMSTEIGVILTTKPGQSKLQQALKLKERYKKKNFYYLLSSNIDPQSLENFPFIEMYINTACERIAFDDNDKFLKPVLNMEDIE